MRNLRSYFTAVGFFFILHCYSQDCCSDPACKAKAQSLASDFIPLLEFVGGTNTDDPVVNKPILDAASKKFGIKLIYTNYDLGGDRYLRTKEALPDSAVEELRKFPAILLGAIGHPDVKPGILEKGILLRTRFELEQYINLRPVKLYDERFCPLKDKKPEDIDFVVVRENNEGLYTGAGGFVFKGTPNEVALQESVNTRALRPNVQVARDALKITPGRAMNDAANPSEVRIEPVDKAELLEHAWIDRDLGWLAFNGRVLHEALDERTPLLERLKFLAIVTSNLDEFFMKRVGMLRGKAHLSDREDQLAQNGDARKRLLEIRTRVLEMLCEQAACYERLLPELARHGMVIATWDQLTPAQRDEVSPGRKPVSL